jgi:hypothetical protein
MDMYVIAGICITLAAFSLVVFLLLRFTATPGFRLWLFAVFVVLSYPVAVGYALSVVWLCAFLPDSLRGDGSGRALLLCIATSAIVMAPVLLWLLARYSLAVRRKPVRILWLVGPASVVIGIVASLHAAAIPEREFYTAWYRTPRQWSEEEAADFASSHQWAIVRAETDHIVSPVGYSRAIRLMDASRDPSGDVFLRFISRHFSSSADLHLLPVYCWSSQHQRLLWKAVEDHSP